MASLYSDRKTMIVGTIASIAATLITVFKTGNPVIWVFAIGFALIGLFRYFSMQRFAAQREDEIEFNARKWERIALAGGIAMGLCLGSWAFFVIAFTEDSFAELVAISACLTNMVGVAARNFGTDSLVTSQSAAIGLPIIGGLFLQGDGWHLLLGFLFAPFFYSSRYLAASIRALFLKVIRTNAKVQFMATHDTLTGLLNRSSFHRVVTANHDARRQSCLLAIFDIDNFKAINDSFGHLAGDHLLIEVGRRLKQVFGPAKIISRFGGDEFVVFMPGGAGKRDQLSLYHKIRSCFEEEFHLLHHVARVNCSVGMAAALAGRFDMDDLLVKADLALHEAKLEGKAGLRVFEAEMNSRFIRREKLKQDIGDAVARNELSVYFQPIFDVSENRVTCCEALLRWDHPRFGQVPPGEFIPLAENAGCISDLTTFVLHQALHNATDWPDDVGVSVNLSALDLHNDKVIREVALALESSALDASRLTLEITESAILSDPVKATNALYGLRQRGVKVALDDFGTGYANFCYLIDIPFDKLKIDRSVTAQIVSEKRSRVLLYGLAEIASRLDMVVTVEGVETQEQLDAVMECHNVNEIQGWIFGIPLPATAIAELLEHQSVPASRYLETARHASMTA